MICRECTTLQSHIHSFTNIYVHIHDNHNCTHLLLAVTMMCLQVLNRYEQKNGFITVTVIRDKHCCTHHRLHIFMHAPYREKAEALGCSTHLWPFHWLCTRR